MLKKVFFISFTLLMSFGFSQNWTVAVTDANMISKEIDQIVLIVKVGQTDKKAFHHTISNLKTIN